MFRDSAKPAFVAFKATAASLSTPPPLPPRAMPRRDTPQPPPVPAERKLSEASSASRSSHWF